MNIIKFLRAIEFVILLISIIWTCIKTPMAKGVQIMEVPL